MENYVLFITGTLGLIALVLGGGYISAKYNEPGPTQITNMDQQGRVEGLIGGRRTKSKRKTANSTRKYKKN